MNKIRYNYSCSNRIKQPWDVEASTRPLHQKGEFLMQPYDTTRPSFISLHPKATNLTGRRFGRLVALGPLSSDGVCVVWLLQCDCGNTHTVKSGNLRNGSTQSCGCLARENTSARSKTHGMHGTRIYKCWTSMRSRCTNPKDHNYQDNYGARGITMCKEWLGSFEAFYGYVSRLDHYGETGYSLDRIKNDGDYEPGNVRWATLKQQGRNTRQNHLLTFDGRTQCVTAWAEELGLKPDMIFCRLRLGWTIERALTQKPRRSPLPETATGRKSRRRLVEADDAIAEAVEAAKEPVADSIDNNPASV